MATYTFVKKPGAPAGALHIQLATAQFTINDTDTVDQSELR